jgi:hypothetical protein
MRNNYKKLIYIIAFSFFLCAENSHAQIFAPEGLNIPGEWNGWTNPPAQGSVFGGVQSEGEIELITFRTRRYTTTLHCAEDGDFVAGSYNFLFTSGPSTNAFQNKWANVVVAPNVILNAVYQGANDNTIETENNSYYTVNFRDNGYANSEVAFLLTSQKPSSFVSIGAIPVTQLPNEQLSITATLDTVPSSDQYFYLLYSTDNFNSSELVSLSVDGINLTGTIPGIAAGNTVRFYLFSSSRSGFSTPDYDLLTLRFFNNNGDYFQYTIGDEEPELEDFTINSSICTDNQESVLDAGAGYDSYLWSTGAETQTISVTGAGIFTVTVGLGNQTATGTFNIGIENAFTISLGEDITQCGIAPVTINLSTSLNNQSDTITIRYDATQGQSTLQGANKVYMHSGIQLTQGGGWSNVVGNWGQDDGIGEMYAVGPDLWEIKFNPQTYYNLNPGQSWFGFWMVFRNEDGTREGKDENGNDIYITATGNPPYSSAFAGVTATFEPSNIQSIVWSNGASGNSITVGESGTYSVTVSNAAGCSVSDTIQVNLINVPIIDLGPDVAICADIFNIVLDAGEGFETYVWSNGAEGQAFVATSYGTYSVTGTTAEGCTASASVTIAGNIFDGLIDLGPDRFICGQASLTLNSGIYLSPQGDSLTIIYNAAIGQTTLVGANKVYMHSSYELEPFSGSVLPWIGNWGQDDGLGEMTSLGNNLWKITIFAPSYYGFPVGTPINGLFMVFRNEDGTREGKDENGNDIFLLLANGTPSSAFSGVTASYVPSAFVSVLWSTGETTSDITVNTPGTYTVVATTADGCTANDSITVSFGQPPMVSLGPTQTICPGESIVLDPGADFLTYEWLSGETSQTITVTQGGTYQVIVSNAPGCEASAFISIIQLSMPSASFTSSQVEGLTVNFTAQQVGGSSYAWDFNGDGTDDFTSNSPLATHQFPAIGTYNVRLTVTNACGSDVFTGTVNVISVNISTPNFSGLIAYPNPANHELFISASLQKSERLRFRISDASGRIVFDQQKSFTQGDLTHHLNVQELLSGFYILEIISENERQSLRFVKK